MDPTSKFCLPPTSMISSHFANVVIKDLIYMNLTSPNTNGVSFQRLGDDLVAVIVQRVLFT